MSCRSIRLKPPVSNLTAVALLYAFLFLFSSKTFGQDFLELRIPKYEVKDATMERAVEVLHAWGIQVCLEKVARQNEAEDVRFSLSLEGATVREVLNALVLADKRYAWERYQRSSLVKTSLINVFPSGAKEDPSHLMNIRTKKAIIKGFHSPESVIPYISYFIPELASKLHPGGGAISMVFGGIGEKMKLQIDFEFEDMTVREILNEIALRTVGRGWVYEVVKGPKPEHRWYVLGWRPRRGNGARDRKGDGL
jgi:hypothetical protein